MPRDPLEPAADILHHAAPFGAEQGHEAAFAKLVAKLRTEDRAQRLADPVGRARGDVHAQRIDDAIAREGVDLEPQLVGAEHLLALHVDGQHALVDPHEALGERDSEGESGAGASELASRNVAIDDAHRLAEAHDDPLAGLGDDRDAAQQGQQQREGEERAQHRVAADEIGHRLAPDCARRWTSGSGR